MTNHVHLLLTPGSPSSTARTLQSVGRRYVNRSYRRSGALWEGRYKSALIDSERYLLIGCRYLDLHPVRANMVAHPRDYRWSSYRVYTEGAANPIITEHPIYSQLVATTEARCAAYRALFTPSINEAELKAIRLATNTGAVLGNHRFREEIEAAIQRKIARLALGVVPKQLDEQSDEDQPLCAWTPIRPDRLVLSRALRRRP